jgi:ATP dependent DNA ligase C terminal region
LCAASLKEEVVASILGALLLGAYRNGKLRYFGHSGTGFSDKGLADAIDRLRPFFIDKSPVENPSNIPEKIQWVQLKLVCEVAFAEWTEDGQLRQTTFLGWRGDKNPKEVACAFYFGSCAVSCFEERTNRMRRPSSCRNSRTFTLFLRKSETVSASRRRSA